jgi:hypothetical protein
MTHDFYDIFLICPVRNATEEQKAKIAKYIEDAEARGMKVYYPARDTNQQDAVGWRICSDNRKAIQESEEIHVFWDSNSTGTLFDLGMAFCLGKRIKIVNIEDVPATVGKSFNNMLRFWEEKTGTQGTLFDLGKPDGSY